MRHLRVGFCGTIALMMMKAVSCCYIIPTVIVGRSNQRVQQCPKADVIASYALDSLAFSLCFTVIFALPQLSFYHEHHRTNQCRVRLCIHSCCFAHINKCLPMVVRASSSS
jgi:hypothetical protein